MASVWSRLTTLPSGLGVTAAWGNFPPQLLTPIDGLAAAIPCDRGHACQLRIVEHGPDDVVGVCSSEDGPCEKRQVLKNERVVFCLDERKLIDAIIHAVGGKSAPPEEIAARPRVLRIGGIPTTGDAQLAIFFVLAGDMAAIDPAVTTLLAHGAEKFLLVVPEEKSIGIVQQNRAGQRGARIIGLDQLLEVADKGTVSTRASGREGLKAWIGKAAPGAGRDSESARFQKPPGTTWKDVTITFMSRDIVSIKCGRQTAQNWERLHLAGMYDATTSEKVPTEKWILLMGFAARGPSLGMNDLEGLFKTRNWQSLRKTKSELSKALRDLFGIGIDPLPFNKRKRQYIPILNIKADTNVNLENWL